MRSLFGGGAQELRRFASGSTFLDLQLDPVSDWVLDSFDDGPTLQKRGESTSEAKS